MRAKRAFAIFAVLMSLPPASLGQQQQYTFASDQRLSVQTFKDELTTISSELKKPEASRDNALINGMMNHMDFRTLSQPDEFVLGLRQRFIEQNASELAKQAAAQALQDFRPDKQLSAQSNSSGTTSLVSKPGASDLVSLALDTGALTQSVNGSTATVSGNLDGIFRAVTGYSPLCVYPCPDMGSGNLNWIDNHVLQPVNVAVVTSLAQQNTTTAPTSGQASGATPTPVSSVAIPTGAGKITGITARYQVVNKYDPHSAAFQKKWQGAADQKNFVTSLLKANDSIVAVRTDILKNATPLDRAGMLAAAKKSDKDMADFCDAYFEDQLQKLGADVPAAVSQAVQNIAASQALWEKVREEAAGTMFTLEYTYNHPLSQPDTHDFKIIYGYAPSSVQGVLSVNGGFSLYAGALPAAAKYGRLRDGQVSAEYDRPFAVSGNPNVLALSLAGYWQYQPNPSVLNIPAGTVAPGTNIALPNGTQEFVGTAGSLFVTQAKITVNVKSGISIPIGVKWSNKSDLLTGNKIGAQVGISYDFSSLSSLFSGSSAK